MIKVGPDQVDKRNDGVLPFFEEQQVPLLRVLTDRGTEYCGQREHHEYQLYLAVENIDHTRTKTRLPRLTASASASIAPFRKSSMPPLSARGSIRTSTSYKRIWMSGSGSTVSVHTTPPFYVL